MPVSQLKTNDVVEKINALHENGNTSALGLQKKGCEVVFLSLESVLPILEKSFKEDADIWRSLAKR